MSEHRRKQTGIVLLILAVFLIATGSFPAEKHIQQTCIGRGIPETALEAVPHLSPEDLISVSGIGKTRLANIRPDLILLSGESEE